MFSIAVLSSSYFQMQKVEELPDLKLYVNRRMSKAKVTDKTLKTKLLRLVKKANGM